MKRLLVLACAATLALVATASPLDLDTRASQCDFQPKCDSTGEEKVGIPCEGYCSNYYLCENGIFSIKQCASFYKFNPYNRQCEFSFRNCDWWKGDSSTVSPNPTGNPPHTQTAPTQDPNKPTSSPTAPTAPTTPEPDRPCEYSPNCDPTGIEKKPIPCIGFCNKYYQCNEGFYTVETCPLFRNFNNVTRECDVFFKKCDWYRYMTTERSVQTSTVRVTNSPTPTRVTTWVTPTTTPRAVPDTANTVTSNFMLVTAVVIPLFSLLL